MEQDWTLMENRNDPKIRCYVRKFEDAEHQGKKVPNFPVEGEVYEVLYPRKMVEKAEDVEPPEISVWSGFLPVSVVDEKYRVA